MTGDGALPALAQRGSEHASEGRERFVVIPHVEDEKAPRPVEVRRSYPLHVCGPGLYSRADVLELILSVARRLVLEGVELYGVGESPPADAEEHALYLYEGLFYGARDADCETARPQRLHEAHVVSYIAAVGLRLDTDSLLGACGKYKQQRGEPTRRRPSPSVRGCSPHYLVPTTHGPHDQS